MGYIKLRIRSRTSHSDGGSQMAKIACMESDMPKLHTNELLLTMHALSAKGGMIEDVGDNGFDYTLDFVLS